MAFRMANVFAGTTARVSFWRLVALNLGSPGGDSYIYRAETFLGCGCFVKSCQTLAAFVDLDIYKYISIVKWIGTKLQLPLPRSMNAAGIGTSTPLSKRTFRLAHSSLRSTCVPVINIASVAIFSGACALKGRSAGSFGDDLQQQASNVGI